MAEVELNIPLADKDEDEDEMLELKELVGDPNDDPVVDVPTVGEVTDKDIGEGTLETVEDDDVDSAGDVIVVGARKIENNVPEVELELG